MPTYTFKSPDGSLFQQRLSFEEYDKVKDGSLILRDPSGEVVELVFNPGNTSFVLKDGLSGGWASKVVKEKTYRSRRREVLAQKERDHVFKSQLIPNYNGQEAHNWAEVRDEARTQKGALAASTYDSLVKEERVKR